MNKLGGLNPIITAKIKKLIEDKKRFNIEVKNFRHDLIHYKKLSNGFPNDFYSKPSFITAPIPGDPDNIINNLSESYRKISSLAKDIIQQQKELNTDYIVRKSNDSNQLHNKIVKNASSMPEGFIFIEENIFPSLLAISEEQQSKGLMYQEWPPPNMSFVYFNPKVNKFWMKNTPSPLDIIFCHGGVISQIHKGEPYSTKSIGNDSLSDLVIELPYGTVKANKIEIGQKVGLVNPTILELKKNGGLY